MSMGAPIKMSLSAPQSHSVRVPHKTCSGASVKRELLNIHCQKTQLCFFPFFFVKSRLFMLRIWNKYNTSMV